MNEFDIKFDVLDQIEEQEAIQLIKNLKSVGTSSEITRFEKPQGALATISVVALISAATVSAAAFSTIAAFLYKAFHRGVLLNLKVTPPIIEKSQSLPRGSLLILYSDGREEFHDNISGDKIGELMEQAFKSNNQANGS